MITYNYQGCCDVDFNFRTYFNLLVNKCARIFEWENLPDTIDKNYLEEQLLLWGKTAFTSINGNYYVVQGNWGKEPNAYYRPCYWVGANPILGSYNLRIRNEDGSDDVEPLGAILIPNSDIDLMTEGSRGLYNLIYQTAGLLADNISSLNVAQINSRAATIYTADSDIEANTAEKVLRDIYAGKPYKVVSQNIVEKFGATPIASAGQSNTLMTLIEAHQYILASFFNEIGVGGNWNMKRERINTAETDLMTDCLDINVQSMEKSRKEAVDRINKKWGLDIRVELNPSIYKEIENSDLLGANQSDNEAQLDGIKEDVVSEPKPAPEGGEDK